MFSRTLPFLSIQKLPPVRNELSSDKLKKKAGERKQHRALKTTRTSQIISSH